MHQIIATKYFKLESLATFHVSELETRNVYMIKSHYKIKQISINRDLLDSLRSNILICPASQDMIQHKLNYLPFILSPGEQELIELMNITQMQ